MANLPFINRRGTIAELALKLADAVKAYNEQRPRQSLSSMNPVQYEKYLKTVENSKRKKYQPILGTHRQYNKHFDFQFCIIKRMCKDLY